MDLSRRSALALLGYALASTAAAPLEAGEGKPAVVVELFTSQGCNSCPPADAFLGELARRPDVIALGFHVDYWDYIGWKDPFAQRKFTERQRGYSHMLGQRYVYTPQMVVDGRYQDVGSDRRAIDRLIYRAQKERMAAGPAPAIELKGDGPGRILRVSGPAPAQPAVILIVGFIRKQETDVVKGENSGKRLANYNIVRALRQVGTFTGAPIELPLDLSGMAEKAEAGVVLVQSADMGPILAALPFSLTN